ncbi:hypothetical protein AERO8C_20333 [Aeromonas veronii]|uniref:Uncharacterized protein n=1 Tax=Aeromonas veronii TaxID=654 RepID=A0A653L0P4_AERVE|nr:hypothetical protein AERO8C_20333 [Aeromonas veronii]
MYSQRSSMIQEPLQRMFASETGRTVVAPSHSALWIDLLFVFAQVLDDTGTTTGLASQTGVTPVQDEPVVNIQLELGGHHFKQFLLHLIHVLAYRKASAVRYPEDMGIDGDGGPAKGGVEYHVGGLAADAGQGFQRFAILRHLAAVALQQDGAGLDDVLGLGVEEANGLDVLLEPVHPEIQHCLRGVGHRIELVGRLVDADIGRLRREQHSNQQLERRVEVELCGGVGVVCPQSLEDLSAFLVVHALRPIIVRSPGREPGQRCSGLR